MKFSLILVVGLIASLHAHADTFVWKTAGTEKVINCAWKCNDFDKQDEVAFELLPLGVTMTGGNLTAVYTSLKHGGHCLATEGLEVPFFVKAHNGVKIIDEAFIDNTQGKCPSKGIWLDPDYFGDITDARQIVLFQSNKKHFDWSVGRKYDFVRKDIKDFDTLTNTEKEFAELHLH